MNHAALCSTRPERKMTTRSVNMEAFDDLNENSFGAVVGVKDRLEQRKE